MLRKLRNAGTLRTCRHAVSSVLRSLSVGLAARYFAAPFPAGKRGRKALLRGLDNVTITSNAGRLDMLRMAEGCKFIFFPSNIDLLAKVGVHSIGCQVVAGLRLDRRNYRISSGGYANLTAFRELTVSGKQVL